MFLEHDDLYQGGGHQHIMLGPKVVEPPEGCRSNHEVICALARRLGASHPGFEMTPRELIDWTLVQSGWRGVADLERAIDFYEGVLGWKAEPDQEGVAFFDLGGVVLSLYPHAELAKDAGDGFAGAPSGPYKGFALAHNARSREEVDEIFARLEGRGATIVKAPEDAFWGGYSGYFEDSEGYRWEVAYNPYWAVDDDGRVVLHP